MEDDTTPIPKPSKSDATHSLVKAGLSAIPYIGGAAVELFQSVLQPPIEKRRIEWMESVGQQLKKLEDNGLALESLQDNEQFLSACLYATQLALRTHQKAKLEAFKNAIANVALELAPEESLQHLFLNFVDELTEVHLRILLVSQSPTLPSNLGLGALSHVLEHNIPELRDRKKLYDQFWRDLQVRGLLDSRSLFVTTSKEALSEKCTTDLGDSFLKFISDHKPTSA